MTEIASVAICGHTDRIAQIERLQQRVTSDVVIDDGSSGSNPTHDQAWRLAEKLALSEGKPWCVVLEDDALPIPGFEEALDQVLSLVPNDSVASLYTGIGRPPQYQQRVAQAHCTAQDHGATFLRHNYLLWGVGVAIPTPLVEDMLTFVQQFPTLPYDYRIGEWMVARGLLCYYSMPSLVDHEDGPTLIAHHDGQPRTEPRKAWSIGIPSMSGLYVDI